MFDTSATKGGRRLCCHPCLSDCEQDISQSYEPIGMKLVRLVGCASLRESGEQDQRQENEQHVYTATADVHRLYR